MLFATINDIRNIGFEGFMTIKNLMFSNCSSIPIQKGVYCVLYLQGQPRFSDKSVGGRFRGKDPTVSVEYLNSKWIEDAIVIYIGQAGGGKSEGTLRSRTQSYMQFGQGRAVGHWGGRLIWQIENHLDLVICWLEISGDDPIDIEKALLNRFIEQYRRLPFANLRK